MKRKNILDAAVKLLATNGLHATPMSAIAKAAGTGMGTIYNYFGTKEILINAIYVDIKQQQESLIPGFNPEESVKEQFERYYLTVTNFYLEHPGYYRVMDQLRGSPIITAESKLLGEKGIQPVIALLQQGQQEGLIKDFSMDELLQFISGTILAHLGWQLNSPGRNPSSLSNQLKMVWDAVKK
ncbi:TetR/AcrR family transcriptional regulator [Neolewinella aurantiaca]|uniref:TetR/AcrR family transcriptional regulator n=1 Tax=Neolewinella aurantiaca TaxID=2602767 RepID=A0A5C7FYA4_9BACT|nr:TetR/AcrR family transcriptional regulator [Neolewinella aurantiaca]TXF90611.1 TetR/AcrR family transcriptional regulator [Neolewinella aurantiaca]